MADKKICSPKKQLLFTPGPLTTSMTVKRAMLRDVGSRDFEFIQTLKDIRNRLLKIGGVVNRGYETVLLQGSGTYAVEAVISTGTPKNGKWLVIVNGAYGKRIEKIVDVLNIKKTVLNYNENCMPDPQDIKKTLGEDSSITNVAIIHHETTTGIVNPIEEVGKIVKSYNKIYFVDAMSSFGAIPIDLTKSGIDYLACTANKNIEGVPGFAFVLVRKEVLLGTEGNARSFTLDLLAQWRGFEKNGQFRFTPPTHSLLAFKQALAELEEEGGVEGRAARYKENCEILVNGMRKMGFTEYLPVEVQGYIIVSFNYPDHPNFNFEEFYNRLNAWGFVIYPGKLSKTNCFRIAVCGHLFKKDILALLIAVDEVIEEMGIEY